jgi:hypothetical protein
MMAGGSYVRFSSHYQAYAKVFSASAQNTSGERSVPDEFLEYGLRSPNALHIVVSFL